MPGALLVLTVSYLLGSLVAGVLYSRARGEDIRGHDLPGGSGTYRRYGSGPALLVTALDMFKGVLALSLARALSPAEPGSLGPGGPELGTLATLGVVMGHCYPLYFRFQGGGGIAPLLGALLVAAPLTLLGTLATGLGVIPLYRATLQPRLKLNAVPFGAAVAVPVGLLLATRFGGLAELLAGGAVMALRALHLLTSRPTRAAPPVRAPGSSLPAAHTSGPQTDAPRTDQP